MNATQKKVYGVDVQTLQTTASAQTGIKRRKMQKVQEHINNSVLSMSGREVWMTLDDNKQLL
jgi:DNA integrity scanning protein DisA with diadenylate cyclase activity